ncbi:hypothetical protein MRB53_016887 [Persea americana]|uniref:Uncharacterized protein n=1 Tax=Persea americana TaxID=3435 RepID=A0ACC2M3F2_PERAE|nr:hypothetical protein MRB53_016887 [Persea americana]
MSSQEANKPTKTPANETTPRGMCCNKTSVTAHPAAWGWSLWSPFLETGRSLSYLRTPTTRHHHLSADMAVDARNSDGRRRKLLLQGWWYQSLNPGPHPRTPNHGETIVIGS